LQAVESFVIDQFQTLRSLLPVVKAFRAPSIHRFLVVAVMMLSWFIITNHCALARLQRHQAANESVPSCHKNKQPPGSELPCREMPQCCKAVKASLSGKAEVKFDTSKGQDQVFAVIQLLSAQAAQSAVPLLFDHGPPRAESFAETVLQRSLLSHAPPPAI
jgi:hypothetical protein